MCASGSFRRAIGYLFDRSPEILFIGGVGNGLPTFVLCMKPEWRNGIVFFAWAVVGGALVFTNNFHWGDVLTRDATFRPWRTLVVLQLAWVFVAWITLSGF